jgi:cobalt/nickel transport system permease protein
MILKIENLAHKNKLKKLPPEQKLFFGLALQILALISSWQIQIVIIFWVAIWLIIYAKIPYKFYFKLLCLSSLFLLISSPAFLVNISTDLNQLPMDSLWGFKLGSFYLDIRVDNFRQFGEIMARSLASISGLFLIILTVPILEIVAVLNKLKVPIILTELLLLVYRFIFILGETAENILTAQKARGGYNNNTLALKSIGLLIGNLFKQTMIRYSDFSLALNARGFNGDLKFLSTKKYSFSSRYMIEFLVEYIILILWNCSVILPKFGDF